MDVEVVRKSRGIDPKERKPRSTAQLPVYREASRLAYVLFRVLKTSPRKMTKMWDESMACAMEILKTLAMANELSGEARMSYISMAIAKSIGCRYSIPISDFWHIHGRTETDSISRPCLRTTGIDISFWQTT